MTSAADHANTVRETLRVMYRDATGFHDEYRDALAALDALAAQAETAETELKEAYAKLERTNESFLAVEAERDAYVQRLADYEDGLSV